MVNMATIEIEYSVAFFIPFALVLLRFKKNETVTGNIAYRHGCNTEINPQRKPSRKVFIKDREAIGNWLLVVSVCAKTIRAEKQNKALRRIFNLIIQIAR